MTDRTLAVLGGAPAFSDGVPFVRPPAPPLGEVFARLAPSYERGMLTNGPLVAELEARVAERLGVRHVVAVASCTAGLMLVVRGLELDAPVLMPSFTFSASAHAVAWNGIAPRFAECDPESFQLDLADAAGRLDGAGAVLATHVFGAPCAPERVEALAAPHGIPVVFDAAHGFGARRAGRPLGGNGSAEVFSLTPTKPLVAGEGGLVTTNDDAIAHGVRIGRDYGNPGDYDTQFVGLNARMSELHAAVALVSLERLDEHLDQRRRLAARYQAGLGAVPGVAVQSVDADDESTFKDFTIAIDGPTFGVDRDSVVRVLRAERVDTRNYFDPPVHRQTAYRSVGASGLDVTDRVARAVVSLPIYPSLAVDVVDKIVEIVADVQARAEEIDGALTAAG